MKPRVRRAQNHGGSRRPHGPPSIFKEVPMKRIFFALALCTFAGLPALAADARQKSLAPDEAIASAQSRVAGEVVAVKFDGSRSEAGHYHLAVRLGSGAIVPIEMDAGSGNLRLVAAPEPSPEGMTLAQAVNRVNKLVRGKITSAELDATDAADPHYHVDLLLDTGRPAWIRVDPNGDLYWREATAQTE
jgi:uncharacterized membrane protein YkoI